MSLDFSAVVYGNRGQRFFIGLFHVDIAARLGLGAGKLATAYAAVTLNAGFLVLHLSPVPTGFRPYACTVGDEWNGPRRPRT